MKYEKYNLFLRSRITYSFFLYSVPHATMASKIGFRLYPVSVRVYSTRGGGLITKRKREMKNEALQQE